jgi:hypothetical protein
MPLKQPSGSSNRPTIRLWAVWTVWTVSNVHVNRKPCRHRQGFFILGNTKNVKPKESEMKTITLAMACFIGFVLCPTVMAYMPAFVIRECPHCRAHVVEEQTVSGNTIGAVLFTDGKRHAPMFPDHPLLARCPVCGGLFWVQEAVEVDYGFEAAEGKKKIQAPSEKDLLDYLLGQALPRKQEKYLRFRAWWAANDGWRWLPNPKPAFSKEQVKNLKALSALLDESDSDQRIFKAEIARELGNFAECLLLLSYQFDKGYDRAVGFIRKLAEENVRSVKQLSPGK